MNIKTSQIRYLKGRNKNYNLKYAILNHIISQELLPNHNVLELFGGIGITTKLIRNKYPIKHHYVVELNQDCLEHLKAISGIKLIHRDAFNVPPLLANDLIFVDWNTFNFSNFEEQVKLLEPYKNKTLIVTETGVFNLKFSHRSPQEHFQRLAERLSKKELCLARVYYTPSFSILVIKPSITNTLRIEKWEEESELWKELVL